VYAAAAKDPTLNTEETLQYIEERVHFPREIEGAHVRKKGK
jgi:hypothetical protein